MMNLEFISKDQFRELPTAIARLFMNYWDRQEHDLCYVEYEIPQEVAESIELEGSLISYDITTWGNALRVMSNNLGMGIEEYTVIPLFTECQLRQLVEKITGCPRVEAIYYKTFGYVISAYESNDDLYISFSSQNNTKDLLQAYWYVCIQLLRQEVEVEEDR